MGYTPLQQASSDGQVAISNFLLRQGADPNAKNKVQVQLNDKKRLNI